MPIFNTDGMKRQLKASEDTLLNRLYKTIGKANLKGYLSVARGVLQSGCPQPTKGAVENTSVSSLDFSETCSCEECTKHRAPEIPAKCNGASIQTRISPSSNTKRLPTITVTSQCVDCGGPKKSKPVKVPHTKLRYQCFPLRPGRSAPGINWGEAGYPEFDTELLTSISKAKFVRLGKQAIEECAKIKLHQINRCSTTVLKEVQAGFGLYWNTNYEALRTNWVNELRLLYQVEVGKQRGRFGIKFRVCGDCPVARKEAVDKLWEQLHDDTVLIQMAYESVLNIHSYSDDELVSDAESVE